jgi:hypothetical protein
MRQKALASEPAVYNQQPQRKFPRKEIAADSQLGRGTEWRISVYPADIVQTWHI